MTIINQLKKEYEIISRYGIGGIWLNTITHHHSFHSAIACQPGDVMDNFCAGATQSHATYLTIQTGSGRHITFDPVYLQYINHSCDPNVFFDTTTMQMICIRPIQPDDELCFFYPSTEWDMAQPFVCNCASKDCLQFINGAAHLNAETLKKYRLTDFILEQVKQQN